METRKIDSAVRVALAVVIGAGVVSCGAGKQVGPESKESGTFRMALVATTNGHTYRLREAFFHIDGPVTRVLDSEAQPEATALVATLDAGSYGVTLAAGWF